MDKIYKDFEREPKFFEAYVLYSHIEMRNALDRKMHTTPTQQPQEYRSRKSQNQWLCCRHHE